MALAPYFDKAALGAPTLLRGVRPDEFGKILEQHVVAIAFDAHACGCDEGRWTVELAVNLLARLYPRVSLMPLGGRAEAHAGELEALARSINPRIELTGETPTFGIAIGSTPWPEQCPVVYVGSNGWLARFSRTEPAGCGTTANPFGAAAAACFGAANVFRGLLGQHLDGGELDDDFEFSLVDFSRTAPRIQPDLVKCPLDEVFLVGAGAIGNGAIWALSRFRALTGRLYVVDPESLEMHNAQRYVLAAPQDDGLKKTEVARREFQRHASKITVMGQDRKWGEYLADLPEFPTLDRVAVAVDSAADRIAIQAALPRWIVNAWTQPGDLGVSRHAFLDGACLACLYVPDAPSKSEGQTVAEALGLPAQVKDIEKLLYTGGAVGEAFVRQLAAAQRVDPGELLAFSTKSLREFYSEVICGGVLLKLGVATEAEVPLAFQSCLAGILLAACVVTESLGKGMPTGTKSTVNLLRPLGDHFTMPIAKHRRGRCICQDADYRAAWTARHGAR